MSVASATRAYARALFELAKEKDAVLRVAEELAHMSEIIGASEELGKLIASNQISTVEKRKIIVELCSKAQIQELTARFFTFLADKRRLTLVAQISKNFASMVDAENNVLRGMVSAADVVSQEQVRDLERAFTQKFKKTVKLETNVESSLLGGLVVQIGDLTFDGSLRSALQNIKQNLERQYV